MRTHSTVCRSLASRKIQEKCSRTKTTLQFPFANIIVCGCTVHTEQHNAQHHKSIAEKYRRVVCACVCRSTRHLVYVANVERLQHRRAHIPISTIQIQSRIYRFFHFFLLNSRIDRETL